VLQKLAEEPNGREASTFLFSLGSHSKQAGWEALSTTSASSLLVDALKFALILITSRSSVNLKEVKSLFECQPKASRRRN
jgi:hypothetical protein